MTSLRERNRLNAKRTVQRLALDMFRERGYDQVTVGEIAAAAGMAASTIYRHFTTKEAIVLWDEHDQAIDEALERRLGDQPPLQAMRDAFVETIGGRYDEDLQFQLGRIQYIYATEQVHGAAIEADIRYREELTDGLRHFLSKANRDAAPILAGAALLAVDIAIERWQDGNATRPLSKHIAEAFDTLDSLGTIG